MCCALTDGFGPGTASPSGLVQRGVICRADLYCPTAQRGEGGVVRHQRGKKSHRRWLITVVLTMPYDTESKSRNADFILIAQEGDTTTLGAKGPVKLKNLPAKGRSILRTFLPAP